MKFSPKPKLDDNTLLFLYYWNNKTDINEVLDVSLNVEKAIDNLFKVLGLKYSKKELKQLQKLYKYE